jgi:phage terminase large subunit-like protein
MEQDDAKPFRAQEGPQRQFCSSPADIAIYGGAAGGGKSYALLLEAAKWTHLRSYRGVIFRRNTTDVMGEGGLWDESRDIYSALGGAPRESPKPSWTFPSGARIAFDHLQHEKSKHGHQGRQYAFVGFDELTHFSEKQFWYLLSRARSKCGVRPYVRATCNPDPDSFVRRLIDWWIGPDGLPIASRSGVLRWFVRVLDRMEWGDSAAELKRRFPGSRPRSLTFIAARLADNKALLEADPDYEANLDAQAYVDRARLKDGNWDVREEAGTLFQRAWFDVVDRAPDDVVRWVRGWDLAATEVKPGVSPDPDWTRGALVGITKVRSDGRRRMVIKDFASLRGMPGSVEALYIATAQQDGRGVEQLFWQDPGGAGKSEIYHIKRNLAGYAVGSVTATKDKTSYAKIWSAMAEPRDGEQYGDVILVRGEWNSAFLAEAQAFDPSANSGHDDMIDAVSRAAVALIQAAPKVVRSTTIRGL